MGYVEPVTESGSGRRDWALWFQPRALEGRVEGLIFAGLCILSLALIAGGILDLLGGHVYNDYLNAALGIILILMGLAAGGLGTFLIVGILYEERLRRREEQVHVTPRGSPPAPPPPWGMADVGKPPGVMRVGDAATAHGGGSPRVMSVMVSNLDAPMLIVGLLAWTILTLVLFAPH